MLILTRRAKDRISFPQLGITIHFIRVHSGQAKVGIDAPREVVIVRSEVNDPAEATQRLQKQILHLPSEVRHGIRNELHEISIAIHLYKELIKSDQEEEAADVFTTIQDALRRLDENEILKKPEQGDASKNGMRSVLVVDDQANERTMLAGFLRLKGFFVAEASDGNHALDYLSEHEPPDLILMDMAMPNCDGQTAVKTLRAAHRFDKTQIFAISGATCEESGLEIGRQCVDQWFVKPVNSERLVSAIENAVIDNATREMTSFLKTTSVEEIKF